MAEANPSVGVVAAYELEGDEVHLDGLPYPSTMLRGRDVGRLYFLRRKYLFGSPTSLLLRSELIRSRRPFYEERRWPFEDAHACFDLLRSWDLGFAHQVLNYTRRDNESIITPVLGFNFELLMRLTFVVVHGQHYLCEGEYSRCLRDAERRYFLYLAKCACARRRRPRDFWEYHRDGLASINYVLGWKNLWKWIPRAVLEKTWDAFWRRWDQGSRLDLVTDIRSGSLGL